MQLHVVQPKALVILLLVLVLAGSVLVVRAATIGGNDSEVRLTHLAPASNNAIEVTEADVARALEIIASDGRLTTTNGGQQFTQTQVRGEDTPGGRIIAFDAVWDTPVNSSGPWLELECQRSIAYELNAAWSNLRSTAVYVNVDSEEVIKMVPGLVAVELGARLDQSSIDFDKVPECPEGAHDD